MKLISPFIENFPYVYVRFILSDLITRLILILLVLIPYSGAPQHDPVVIRCEFTCQSVSEVTVIRNHYTVTQYHNKFVFRFQ